MEDELRPKIVNQSAHERVVANVVTHVVEATSVAGDSEEGRLGGRVESDPDDLGAEVAQPEGKPSTLESGVAGDEDALARKYLGKIRSHLTILDVRGVGFVRKSQNCEPSGKVFVEKDGPGRCGRSGSSLTNCDWFRHRTR